MKKIISLTIAVLMLVAMLAGCGNSTPAATEAASANSGKEYTVSVCQLMVHESPDKATQKIVEKYQLTTLMVTHNMRDAIHYSNRLIMMYNGHVVVDVSGEGKKRLTVEQLLSPFSQASGSDEVDDKLVLS